MKTVLSCIQPTGDIHLGNYFGAVANWVKLQNDYHCYFGVVDCHGMTMPYDANKLRTNTWNMACQLLALGVEEENLFIQSLVPEHLQLSWILSCVCSYGELSRMTQFKDKMEQLRSGDKDVLASSGLFIYPVLQAADILIYQADLVPVGKDQEQHLELTRNIAERFNHQFNTDFFKLPAPLMTDVRKLLSTADPAKKMSKSLGERHYINIFGEQDFLIKQIKTAVTDAGGDPSVMSPGVQNLFTILKESGDQSSHDSLKKDFESGTLKYSSLKEATTEALLAFIHPFKEKYKAIQDNQAETTERIIHNSRKIRLKAIETYNQVAEITGIMSPNANPF